MIYVLTYYWPFVLAALGVGVLVGWWTQDRRRADALTDWLEHGPDEQ